MSGNVTLAGAGTVTMSNNANNVIMGNSTGTEILTSANTIQGSGNIGDAFMGFVNTGKVIANQGNNLYIDVDASGFTNKGTVQANAGSLLGILGPSGSFTNLNSGTSTLTGGAYVANGTIQFGTSNATANDIVTNAANITLSGTSSQIIDQFGGNALTGLASNASGGSFTINSGRNFTSAGNFTNNGTLAVGSGSSFVVNGNLTNFSGTTLTGGAYNVTGTLQFNGANIVTNAANITLIGSGNIVSQTSSNGLANFAANTSSGKFTIGGTRTFITKGNFTNNGTLTTSSSASKFDVNGSLTNFSGTTLTGGTYNMTGTLQFNGANIVTNSANITLSGAASQIIDQSSSNGLANFATNAAGASFTINSGRNFTTASNFTNNGTLAVGSANSTFNVNGNLTNFSGGTLTGGTYNLTGALQFNGANITSNAANLTLTGTSARIIDQSSNNGLANFATNASTGKFTLNGNRTFTTGGSFTNAGLFTVVSGSTFTVGGSGTGLTQSGGTTTDDGTLSVGSLFNVQAGSLFGKGVLSGNVQSSGVVTPGDSGTATGILTDKGIYTQTSTGTLDISIGGTTAGTKFDQLNPTNANLNGTLNISLINGFAPTVGSTFKIMNFGSASGTFATVNGLSINSSEHFAIAYQGTDVLLTVASGPGASSLTRPSYLWSKNIRPAGFHSGRFSPESWKGFFSARGYTGSDIRWQRGMMRAGPLANSSFVNANQVRGTILNNPSAFSSVRVGMGSLASQSVTRNLAPLVKPVAVGSMIPSTPDLQFNHIFAQVRAASAPQIAPGSFASRTARPAFSGTTFTPSRGSALTPPSAYFNRTLTVPSRLALSSRSQFLTVPAGANGGQFTRSFAIPPHGNAATWSASPSPFVGLRPGRTQQSLLPFTTAPCRGTSARHSFSVSLWNVSSKPKVGFNVP
jgi:hypothetical protein